MRGLRLAAAIVAGVLLGVVVAGVMGVGRVLRLLAEDEARQPIQWDGFPDPD